MLSSLRLASVRRFVNGGLIDRLMSCNDGSGLACVMRSEPHTRRSVGWHPTENSRQPS